MWGRRGNIPYFAVCAVFEPFFEECEHPLRLTDVFNPQNRALSLSSRGVSERRVCVMEIIIGPVSVICSKPRVCVIVGRL